MDEILDGVVQVLSRSPEKGEETSNPGIRALTAHNWRDRTLVIYYSIPDDDHVVLESIVRAGDHEKTEPPEEEE